MASHQLRPLVGVRFQVLFTPLLAVLFTFPSRYWFAIGLPGVFSLGGWCRRIRRGFLRSPPTQEHDSGAAMYTYGTLTPCGRPSQAVQFNAAPTRPVLQPRPGLDPCGLGFSAFARRYLRNHSCFLLLRVLRCFSSPRLPRPKTVTALRQPGCPIRTPADQSVCAAPRRFSQLAASFLASGSPGIPRTPLFSPAADAAGHFSLVSSMSMNSRNNARMACSLWRITDSNR